MQHLLRNKLHEGVARIIWPLHCVEQLQVREHYSKIRYKVLINFQQTGAIAFL